MFSVAILVLVHSVSVTTTVCQELLERIQLATRFFLSLFWEKTCVWSLQWGINFHGWSFDVEKQVLRTNKTLEWDSLFVVECYADRTILCQRNVLE